jgi:large subunit ribosomal protein L24
MVAPAGLVRSTKQPELRKGDQVVVLTGKDAGKRGKVDKVIRATGGRASGKAPGARGRSAPRARVSVVVEGINIAKRHTKPRQRQSRTTQMPTVQAGGILELAQPLDISNVMLVCPSCGRPTRVKHAVTEAGASLRTCAHCGESVNREEKA